MEFYTERLSQTIVKLCRAKGIKQVVISPGSRSAPLTIGFTTDAYFENFSIVDERCAAFFALGLAQQSGLPVAVVCTSGSALLNYYPAVAEAFYSDIPLVVISADRPEHLLEIGDGQTIVQQNVFKNHILYSANCATGGERQTDNGTEINIALNTAIELQGPVHINAPFAEPLYGTVADVGVKPKNAPPREITHGAVLNIGGLKDAWAAAKRKIVLVGVLKPDSIPPLFLEQLARDPSVIVLTETTSNVHHPSFFPNIDELISTLTETARLALQPELLLTFGGMIVSKRIKAFFRGHPPKAHWHVHEKKAYDTFFVLKEHIKTTPATFLKLFLKGALPPKSSFQPHWAAVKKDRERKNRAFTAGAPFSDFTVYCALLQGIPNGYTLHIANSAAVRYAQLFKGNPTVATYCNRGTSGIDGSMATAIGAAVNSSGPVVFVTGDLSFFYDSNALWNANIPPNFRVAVVNNGGGGIFRILPGAKNVEGFTTFFEARHGLNASKLAEMFGFEYAPVAEM
ncbi:MAG: 2-succinyl-5-enolpyruvyl-6-hydroxy-3-cyclohexene-1-carboxylic-acid synthase, partial [Marinirhabdus sp.]